MTYPSVYYANTSFVCMYGYDVMSQIVQSIKSVFIPGCIPGDSHHLVEVFVNYVYLVQK